MPTVEANWALISESGIYQSFFDHHPDAVYVLDLHGDCRDANPACIQLLGYSRQELLRTPFKQIVVPEGLDRCACDDVGQWVQAKSITFETTAFHKHGHRVEIRVTHTPIVVGGNVIGVFGIAKDVTQQKRVEQELIDTERLYKLISENSEDIISYCHPDGTFGYISPSVETLLDYKQDELIGKANTCLYHPDDIPYVAAIGERIRSGEDVPRFTCRVRRKNGSYRWYETTLKFIRDEQENLVQMVGIGRDISEQMALSISLEHAVTMAKLGHWEWDLKTGNVSYSRQSYRNLGIDNANEVFTVERFASFVHPEDLESWREEIGKAVDARRTFDHTFRISRTDGAVRFLHSCGELVYDDDGVPVRMAGIAQDITEHKLLELQLQQSEERYRTLVENSLDAIGVFEDRKCVFMNSIGLQMFGATSEEIIGSDYFDFLHPSHYEESERRLQAIMWNERLRPIEYKWVRKNGEVFHAEVLGSRFSDTAIQVCIRDITERKQAYELLLRSEKLSAVGQLAAGIAHEIRNPLTALKGFTQMLREKSRGTKRRYFDIMSGELDRIEMILNEMLVLAKPQDRNFELKHVDLILLEVITFLSPQAMMKNVTIQTDFQRDLPMLSCEEGQLKQVFVNIIKNGIEAMPSGGNMLVRLKTQGDKVVVEFVDEGVGIPEDCMPKLGEPFFTTKEKGTGLGLMISHKIISAHNGTIGVQSRLGEGTTVSLSLPVGLPNR